MISDSEAIIFVNRHEWIIKLPSKCIVVLFYIEKFLLGRLSKREIY